jgi:hypothetical protein
MMFLFMSLLGVSSIHMASGPGNKGSRRAPLAFVGQPGQLIRQLPPRPEAARRCGGEVAGEWSCLPAGGQVYAADLAT